MSKTMGLYKRGSVWWIRYAGPDGRIHCESTKSAKQKEAVAMLHKRKTDILEGRSFLVKKIPDYPFKELAEKYHEWCQYQKGFVQKKNVIRRLVAKFGNLMIRKFNTMLVEQYQAEFLARKKAPATANKHLQTLKHMFNKAVEWEMLSEEVARKVSKVKALPENNTRLRYLSTEECKILIDACDPHIKPIVITALNTGMRKSEILTLEWSKHIDLTHGFILLDITKNGERREIPINSVLKETFKGLERRLGIPYVFFNPETSRPYKDFKRSFSNALTKTKIADFRFHDLRHTFASQLVMAGIDLTTVKELLGHKTLTMTLRYSHLAPSHKVKALKILEEVIAGSHAEKPTVQKLYNS